MTTRKTLKLTLVRHGESVDNVSRLIAGHKDSSLTSHGHLQAQALYRFFSSSSTSFDMIYSSDLRRARLTAQELQPLCPTPIIISSDLRERNFGVYEGQRYSHESMSSLFHDPDQDFEGTGESLTTLKARAFKFLTQTLLQTSPTNHQNICMVSHGIFIGELIKELRLGSGAKGLRNTGWMSVVIEVMGDGTWRASRGESGDGHLAQVGRQPGGIGSSEYDPKQRTLMGFMGGGGAS